MRGTFGTICKAGARCKACTGIASIHSQALHRFHPHLLRLFMDESMQETRASRLCGQTTLNRQLERTLTSPIMQTLLVFRLCLVIDSGGVTSGAYSQNSKGEDSQESLCLVFPRLSGARGRKGQSIYLMIK